ncbi:uncharacterized protein lrrc41 isoform X1 [Sparus aurata]|uniref:Leucine-rich repeat-containing protein 41 n=1 Tax=Sparus aurata TaxID=8175 RepID=A0A671Y7Z2_SPAAU|nr:leucine-rich repeat-containing protein 41 isoform X1 [Sparus aurata]
MEDSAGSSEQGRAAGRCLRALCLQAVRTHFSALGVQALLDLPVPLIKDLLHHLTICQLDELQPALNHRGISTYSAWVGFLLDICGQKHVLDVHTEEEAKHRVMRRLFTAVFYGFTNSFIKRNLTDLSSPSFLMAAAKCVRHFTLMTAHKPLQGLTAEQRPLLNLLEKHIRSVGVSQCIDLKKKTASALYVLHRLLDHGVATELLIHLQSPIVLAWLLHGRGSQHMNPELKNLMHSKKRSCNSAAASASADKASCSLGLTVRPSEDQEDQVPACKRSKMDCVSVEEEEPNYTMDPQALCLLFSPCNGPSAGPCPSGQIHRLEIRNCGSDSLAVLNPALPTFFCLRSLTLHSSTFRDPDVWSLAGALRQLFHSSCSSLTHLSISVLPHTDFVEILLDSIPTVTSLHVEIQSVMGFSPRDPRTAESHMSELRLEKLTIKVAELQTDVHCITSVLRRSPHLTSFHAAGIRLPTGSSHSQLLTTLSESNRLLRSLILEDMKLSDCLPDLLNLLTVCRLEELSLNDCRLLEKCIDQEEGLQQLVSALKTLPSLHTLSLAQNRLARSVYVLAELFSGGSASSVKRLDISSNFIQPAELLNFTERLKTHCPPHLLTLDLRKNPADRDPHTWNTALKGLRPFCVLLVEGWTSTNMMADHISNM